jgi:hypothetical protein
MNETYQDLESHDERVTSKLGHLVTVKNRDPLTNTAKAWYHAVWVKDAETKEKKCLLFTQREISKAEYRASRNSEDLPQRSFFARLFNF